MYVLKTECHFTHGPAGPGHADEGQNIFRRPPGLHRTLAAEPLLEVWREGGVPLLATPALKQPAVARVTLARVLLQSR